MKAKIPSFKHLVLIGGGHANLQVLHSFAMNPVLHLDVTLVSDQIFAPYSGMLPGHLAGWYSFAETHFDLVKLSQRAGIRFLHDEVVGFEAKNRKVICKNRGDIAFDFASINVGSQPKTEWRGENIFSLKPISIFLNQWNAFVTQLETRDPKEMLNVAIVGGGASGVEIALVISRRLSRMRIPANIRILHKPQTLLSGHAKNVQEEMQKVCEEQKIQLHFSEEVSQIENGKIQTNLGTYSAEFVFVATQADSPKWFKNTDLPLNSDGFVKIDQHLEIPGFSGVFAAGDCTDLWVEGKSLKLPKSGVYAVRQGPILNENLRRRMLDHGSLRKYKPQKKSLALITTGKKEVIASYGSFGFRSALLWKVKDAIDRRFMMRFQNLNLKMQAEESPSSQMRLPSRRSDEFQPTTCGGCGSKVDREILNASLFRQKREEPSWIKKGLNFADDVAVVSGDLFQNSDLILTTDFFPTFTSDYFFFGRALVLHAMGDCWAKGAKGLGALATVGIPQGAAEIEKTTLSQMMRGIEFELSRSGVALLGGHSFYTSDPAAGLMVVGQTGLRFFPKFGLRPGDSVILTKPIGTGVLIAKMGMGLGTGQESIALSAQILQSHFPILETLASLDIVAATDLTGFGLAGHLLEMLGQDELRLELKLQKIPWLAEAKAAWEAGEFATMTPKNKRAFDKFVSLDFRQSWVENLLFEPQTSGGFLLAVRSLSNWEQVKVTLNTAGFQPEIIGKVHLAQGTQDIEKIAVVP